jgi:RNA polymerase sigma-70 factor (ECF subfamily)
MIEVPVAASQDSTVELDDVLAVLQTLPEADQEIIRLSRFEGLSHEQIAEQLNVQLGTAYSRLSRATAKLRAACEGAPEDSEEDVRGPLPLPASRRRVA